MKPEASARWEKTRARARGRYILAGGVLSCGLPMSVFMTFLVHRSDPGPGFIRFSAAMWLLGGALVGTSMWRVLERRYRKAIQRGSA